MEWREWNCVFVCLCACVWAVGGCLNPFSPPACPHPVFSRAACESSQRAEGPSCLPLPPPSFSAFPSLNPPLPVSRPSSKPEAAISRLAFLSPFSRPHTGFQAKSSTLTRKSPIDHFLSERQGNSGALTCWSCLEHKLNVWNDTHSGKQCPVHAKEQPPSSPITRYSIFLIVRSHHPTMSFCVFSDFHTTSVTLDFKPCGS